MRLNSKLIVVSIALILLALPTTSDATLADLEWKVQVGDRIDYTYLGISVHDETVTVEEEIYFTIDDLTGIPIPTTAGPSVTAYWQNGSLVDPPGEEILGWYTENLQLIDAVAVRAGNWTLYDDIVKDYWESRELPVYVVTLEESSQVWNATVSVYWPEDVPTRRTAYSYSKSTGILLHSYYVRYIGGNESEFDYYLSLTRLDTQSGTEYIVVLGSAAIVGILVILIILKKRK